MLGAVIDLETTGLDPLKDQIIEVGIVQFCFQVNTPDAPTISEMYGGLQDPGRPLSEDIVRITGLTDFDLANRSIRWPLVEELLSGCDLVVAHNMDFDRSFIRALPNLAPISGVWGCSMRHIDWAAKGHKTQALNYIAADQGFVNPFAHRALFDCATTFRIIAPHLTELYERCQQREFEVRALGAPFASKDVLKARGYRWDGDARVWHKTFAESALPLEREFLASQVYGGTNRSSETIVS